MGLGGRVAALARCPAGFTPPFVYHGLGPAGSNEAYRHSLLGSQGGRSFQEGRGSVRNHAANSRGRNRPATASKSAA